MISYLTVSYLWNSENIEPIDRVTDRESLRVTYKQVPYLLSTEVTCGHKLRVETWFPPPGNVKTSSETPTTISTRYNVDSGLVVPSMLRPLVTHRELKESFHHCSEDGGDRRRPHDPDVDDVRSVKLSNFFILVEFQIK